MSADHKLNHCLFLLQFPKACACTIFLSSLSNPEAPPGFKTGKKCLDVRPKQITPNIPVKVYINETQTLLNRFQLVSMMGVTSTTTAVLPPSLSMFSSTSSTSPVFLLSSSGERSRPYFFSISYIPLSINWKDSTSFHPLAYLTTLRLESILTILDTNFDTKESAFFIKVKIESTIIEMDLPLVCSLVTYV